MELLRNCQTTSITMTKEDKSHIHCTHCGMKKHTKETCFKIVGYSEWWEDSKPKNRKVATTTVTHRGGKEKRIPA